MAILAELKVIRERRALTQAELARRAGISRITVTRLENGREMPFPTTTRKLADALEVRPEQLFAPERPGEALTSARLGTPTDSRVVSEPDVERVLGRVAGLAALIGEAAGKLLACLPDARLHLRVVADPEFEGAEQLFLGVTTDLDEEAAIDALRGFDRDWWVHNVHRARGALCIDLADG